MGRLHCALDVSLLESIFDSKNGFYIRGTTNQTRYKRSERDIGQKDSFDFAAIDHLTVGISAIERGYIDKDLSVIKGEILVVERNDTKSDGYILATKSRVDYKRFDCHCILESEEDFVYEIDRSISNLRQYGVDFGVHLILDIRNSRVLQEQYVNGKGEFFSFVSKWSISFGYKKLFHGRGVSS
ncbi:MAG: hypothetical protein V2I51_19495 [Anderseniella sp.]|jgi:hypothetical protein|nr:hypothetical protein [Anderseniella sp.]